MNMSAIAHKTEKNTVPASRQKSHSVSAANAQIQSARKSNWQFMHNGPAAIAQRKPQEEANNSTHATPLQAMTNNATAMRQQPIQQKENRTGMPDRIKTGIESLSGMSMDDVKVHRNSDKPARLQAHAFARGTDIHLGPGQERHLPHEAWHVVQQKQGRVKSTTQLKGKINLNDDVALEKEADVMGAKSLALKPETKGSSTGGFKEGVARSHAPIQMKRISTNYGISEDEKYTAKGKDNKTMALKPEPGPSLSQHNLSNPMMLKEENGMQSGGGKHEVQKGENLTEIAEKYGTTVENIVEWNGIKNKNLIKEGDSLIVSPEEINIEDHVVSDYHLSFTITYEGEWETNPYGSWLPFAWDKWKVKSIGEISDLKMDLSKSSGFDITIRVPKSYVHSQSLVTYTEYKYQNKEIDGLSNPENWTQEKSLLRTFYEGAQDGFIIALMDNLGGNLKSKWLWKRVNSLKRGLRLENVLGGNLVKGFPVIDKFKNGIATSIKSLDLDLPSYMKASGLKSTVKKYINSLEKFDGASKTYKGITSTVTQSEIKKKVLMLAVPHLGNGQQRHVLKNLIQYAETRGVRLQVLTM